MRTKFSHGKVIADLLKALQLPVQISVIHGRTHTGQKDEVSKGNNFADRAVKFALQTWQTHSFLLLLLVLCCHIQEITA